MIEPLFLDDLRAEFERLKRRKDNRRRADLRRFQRKLGNLTFFDPACGCGNFLIIAYRELRELEIQVLKEIHPDRQLDVLARDLSVVDVDQFYGIELGEFPARIAETALWMMDHIMNNRLSLEFGQTYVRIPLETSPHIVHGDALETDWSDLLSPDECSFVFGNPPFGGSKFQSQAQRAQVRRIADLGGAGGTLDYVTAWFIKAGEYADGTGIRIGFVATNSITQGEQVAQLWPILFNRYGLEIAFAHRTFAWGSDARGKAHVHVVIIGLDGREAVPGRKRLFSYPDINGDPEETEHSVLSPYLFDASWIADPHLTVREESAPVNGLPKLIIGSKPIDGGHYIFRTAKKRAEFVAAEPAAERYVRPYIGGREYLRGGSRWILALHEAPPNVLASMPTVRKRIAAVRSYREASQSPPTRKLAETPTLYHVNVIPAASFLVVPEVSSERREYVPIGWLEPPVIPSNKLRILAGAALSQFAVLTSAMHMAWLRYIGGRLKSDYSYGIGMVYNTFPMPPVKADLSKLDPLAQAVLDARDAFPDATLADLYDPDLMPRNSAAPTRPSTAPWIGSIVGRGSPQNVSAPSICSCSTRRCAHPSASGSRNRRGGDARVWDRIATSRPRRSLRPCSSACREAMGVPLAEACLAHVPPESGRTGASAIRLAGAPRPKVLQAWGDYVTKRLWPLAQGLGARTSGHRDRPAPRSVLDINGVRLVHECSLSAPRASPGG